MHPHVCLARGGALLHPSSLSASHCQGHLSPLHLLLLLCSHLSVTTVTPSYFLCAAAHLHYCNCAYVLSLLIKLLKTCVDLLYFQLKMVLGALVHFLDSCLNRYLPKHHCDGLSCRETRRRVQKQYRRCSTVSRLASSTII